MKAQTSLVLIILLIIIFGGIVLFLLSLAKTVPRVELDNLYVHNLLLSVLRTNTPYYTDTRCALVSDTIHCAYYEPSWRCGRSGPYCLKMANDTVSGYMKQFEQFRKNYRYLFVVEPEMTIVRDGEIIELMIGDTTLSEENIKRSKEKIDVIAANERIQKGLNILNVQLRVAKR